MSETLELLEYSQDDEASIQEDGVIRNVLILGQKSRNKTKLNAANGKSLPREYSAEAMREAAPFYEGSAVYDDHPSKSDLELKRRKPRDRFGVINNPRFVESEKGPEIRGDLTHLTSHAMSAPLAEDRRRKLNFFGLSHWIDGEVDHVNGKAIVTKITRVKEVDLVTQPGTTTGLMEAEETYEDPAADKTPEQHTSDSIHSAIDAILKEESSVEEKCSKIEEVFRAMLADEKKEPEAKDGDKPADKVEPEKKEEKADAKESAETLASLTESLANLTAEVTTLKAEIAKPVPQRKFFKTPPATEPPAVLSLAEAEETFPTDPKEVARRLRRA